MSELAAPILAGVAAASLAVAYIAVRQAAAARREADEHRSRANALARALLEAQAANNRLSNEVRSRERAIGELLDRMNRTAVAAVAAQRIPKLGLPIHRVDPQRFSRN